MDESCRGAMPIAAPSRRTPQARELSAVRAPEPVSSRSTAHPSARRRGPRKGVRHETSAVARLAGGMRVDRRVRARRGPRNGTGQRRRERRHSERPVRASLALRGRAARRVLERGQQSRRGRPDRLLRHLRPRPERWNDGARERRFGGRAGKWRQPRLRPLRRRQVRRVRERRLEPRRRRHERLRRRLRARPPGRHDRARQRQLDGGAGRRVPRARVAGAQRRRALGRLLELRDPPRSR